MNDLTRFAQSDKRLKPSLCIRRHGLAECCDAILAAQGARAGPRVRPLPFHAAAVRQLHMGYFESVPVEAQEVVHVPRQYSSTLIHFVTCREWPHLGEALLRGD